MLYYKEGGGKRQEKVKVIKHHASNRDSQTYYFTQHWKYAT